MQRVRQVSNEELRKILRSHILCNSLLNNMGENPSTINITGEHDSGKTTLLRETYEEAGFKCIEINLADKTDTYDLNGNPVVQVQLQRCEKDGKNVTFFVNEQIASSFINDHTILTGKQRTTYILPKKIEEISNSSKHDKVVLLLDDYNRANSFVLAAVMELINTGKYSAWEGQMPKDFQVALSSNFDNGENNVAFIDKANQSRMAIVELVWNVEDYLTYRFKEEILLPIRNYVASNKEYFKNTVIKRRFEHVIKAYKFFKNNSISYSDFVNKVILECPDIKTAFLSYLNDHDLLTLREMLNAVDIDESFKNTFISKSGKLDNAKVSLFISNLFFVLEKEVESNVQNFSKEDFENLFDLATKYFGKDLLHLLHARLLGLQKVVKDRDDDNSKSHYIFDLYFNVENYEPSDKIHTLESLING